MLSHKFENKIKSANLFNMIKQFCFSKAALTKPFYKAKIRLYINDYDIQIHPVNYKDPELF